MARVLILSSWVSFGHVGLCAGTPVLMALGHEVTQLPTTILSNHPGWAHAAGAETPVPRLRAMIEALAANGWLASHTALLVGYMPSPGHVALARETAERLRQANPEARLVVDPVLGDAPKGLYVPEEVAVALRDMLVPRADVLTPNLFELAWLAGRQIDGLSAARAAARALAPRGEAGRVLLTSPPLGDGRTGILEVSEGGAQLYPTPLRAGVPHGVGDAFSAMIAAGLPVGQALGHLDALIEASLGAPHLNIAAAASRWVVADPVPAAPDPLPEEV